MLLCKSLCKGDNEDCHHPILGLLTSQPTFLGQLELQRVSSNISASFESHHMEAIHLRNGRALITYNTQTPSLGQLYLEHFLEPFTNHLKLRSVGWRYATNHGIWSKLFPSEVSFSLRLLRQVGSRRPWQKRNRCAQSSRPALLRSVRRAGWC